MDTTSHEELPYTALALDDPMMLSGGYSPPDHRRKGVSSCGNSSLISMMNPQDHLHVNSPSSYVAPITTTTTNATATTSSFGSDDPMTSSTDEEYKVKEESCQEGLRNTNYGGDPKGFIIPTTPNNNIMNGPVLKPPRLKSSERTEYRIVTFVEKHTGRKKSIRIRKKEFISNRDDMVSSSAGLCLTSPAPMKDSTHNEASTSLGVDSRDLDVIPPSPGVEVVDSTPLSDSLWPNIDDIVDDSCLSHVSDQSDLSSTNDNSPELQEMAPLQQQIQSMEVGGREISVHSPYQPIDIIEPLISDVAVNNSNEGVSLVTASPVVILEEFMLDPVDDLNDLLIGNGNSVDHGMDNVFGVDHVKQELFQREQQQQPESLESFFPVDSVHNVADNSGGNDEPSMMVDLIPLQMMPLPPHPSIDSGAYSMTMEELNLLCDSQTSNEGLSSSLDSGYLPTDADQSGLLAWGSNFGLGGDLSDLQVDYDPGSTFDINSDGQEISESFPPTNTFDLGSSYFPRDFDPSMFMNQNLMVNDLNNESSRTKPHQYEPSNASRNSTWSTTLKSTNYEQNTVRRVKKSSVKTATTATAKKARNSKRNIKGDIKETVRKDNSIVSNSKISKSSVHQQQQHQSDCNSNTTSGHRNNVMTDPFEVPEVYATMIQKPLESLRLLASRIRNNSRLI